MSIHPADIWEHVSPELQQRITDDLSSIFQEIIHDYIRIDYTTTSAKESRDLRPAIDADPGHSQSGKPPVAVRPRTACPKFGVEIRGH